MAIIIPSANIYKMQNDKILDNRIEKIECPVNITTKNMEKQSVSRYIYKTSTDNEDNLQYDKLYFDNFDNYEQKTISTQAIGIDYNVVVETLIFDSNDFIYFTQTGQQKVEITQKNITRGYSVNRGGSYSDNWVSTIRVPVDFVNNKEEFDNLSVMKNYDYMSSNIVKKGWSITPAFNVLVQAMFKSVVFAIDKTLSTNNKIVAYFESIYNVTSGGIDENIPVKPKSGSKNYNFMTDYTLDFCPNVLNKKENSKSYGSGKPFAMQNNELIQNNTKNNNIEISEFISNKILTSYQNGKEIAIIKCSINNYYNEDTSIAKSITDITKDMTFRMYDKVIPMIPSPNGDVPMSKHKDGTNKIFKVLGTKIEFTGAVWQTIYLQEV